MLNSVVELYRLDMCASYQHAFVYIRQLAVHLRNAIVVKKKDAHLQVYNWQFVYALRVWAKLLGDTLAAAVSLLAGAAAAATHVEAVARDGRAAWSALRAGAVGGDDAVVRALDVHDRHPVPVPPDSRRHTISVHAHAMTATRVNYR